MILNCLKVHFLDKQPIQHGVLWAPNESCSCTMRVGQLTEKYVSFMIGEAMDSSKPPETNPLLKSPLFVAELEKVAALCALSQKGQPPLGALPGATKHQ